MTEKRTRGAVHLTANLIIIALIVLLNGFMFRSDAVAVLSSGIRYRTDDRSAVAVECILAWDSENLTDILQVLRDNDTRITFAVTGEYARDFPEKLAQIASEGHTFLTMGMKYSDADILTESELTQSIKESVAWFGKCEAAPAGFYSISDDTRKVTGSARSAGLACVRCTNDLLCARGSADDIKERAAACASGGSIIAVTPTRAFVQALPDILKGYRNRGLTVSGVHG